MYSTNITTTRPTTAAEISTFKRQVAGWGLIVPYCGIFAVYIVCLLSMLKLRKQYPLFGFLISFSCADLGIIVLAIYVGFGIMLQANPLGDVVTFSWLNFFWNPMIFHYSIVAVSRFMGIIYYQKVVVWFPVRNICIICGICWTIGIGIQVWFNFLPSSYYVFRADKLGVNNGAFLDFSRSINRNITLFRKR